MYNYRLVSILVLLFTTGCSGEGRDLLLVEEHADGGGGAGGVGGSISAAGGSSVGGTAGAGVGGANEQGRGDPADFPAECIETCVEACAELAACNGQNSPLFPLTEENCTQRCELAEGGPMWGDVSVNFKCCTSQSNCTEVEHCGGWLAHPDVEVACNRMCACQGATSLDYLYAGYSPPQGYRFAADVVHFEPNSSFDLSTIPYLRIKSDSPIKLVQFDSHNPPSSIDPLADHGRMLPTFIDSAGRFSGATGNIILVVDSDEHLSHANALAAQVGFAAARPLPFTLSKSSLGDRSPGTSRPRRLYVLKGNDGFLALEVLPALNQLTGVTAELDMVRYYQAGFIPDDAKFAEQWYLLNEGQNGSTVGVDARVTEAWDLSLGDPQVIIAINDNGVDLDHPEFAGKLEPALAYPADWQQQMVAGKFGDHGTMCAGVAAAEANNTTGIAGACPNCRILPNLMGANDNGVFQMSDQTIADGFKNMVDAGAWIISNSWAPFGGDPQYQDFSGPPPAYATVIQASFDYAEINGRNGKGTVIVFSAGNSNGAYNHDYPSLLTVAAVSDVGLKAFYSTFGSSVDVTAPSNGGLNGVATTTVNSDYTANFGGTSASCPLVAGIAGLVLSANGNLTAAEVRDIIKSSATRIDPVFGQWDSNGWSKYYGNGLVNAYRAVALAAGSCTDPNNCVAPSDECGSECRTAAQCGACRIHSDCSAGYVCQALPSLGRTICVAEATNGICPSGTQKRNGYCLPEPQTCGLCNNTELCNGRDDNCDGQVDEGGVCPWGTALCFADGPGCASGQVCAGFKCVDSCNDDDDCSAGMICKLAKDQFGYLSGGKGCAVEEQAFSASCRDTCETLASSTDDQTLADFVACIDNAPACRQVYPCMKKLPFGP